MTAEEQQEVAFQALVDARNQKKADIKVWDGLVSAQAKASAAADAAYQAYLTAQKTFTDAQTAQFVQRTKIDVADTNAIYNASQAYNEATNNHGLILT